MAKPRSYERFVVTPTGEFEKERVIVVPKRRLVKPRSSLLADVLKRLLDSDDE